MQALIYSKLGLQNSAKLWFMKLSEIITSSRQYLYLKIFLTVVCR